MSVADDSPADFLVRSGVSRYDLLLALLPIPILCGLVAAILTGVPVAVGVGLGGVPTALLLGYGLFVDAPVRRTGGRDRGRTGI